MMKELIRKISNYLILRSNFPHPTPPPTHEVRKGRLEGGRKHPQIGMKKLLFPIVIILFLASCSTKPKEELVPNIPPQTYIYVEGRADTVPAKVFLRWYGNDPDGYVVGYYYNWDNDSDTVFTTANCDTFSLSSAGSVEVHVFKIWAEDNEGAVDPTPASVIVPVTNSPPTIQFQRGTLPPDTTLPVATYYLEWHDVDGDSTVIGFYYMLDTDTIPHFVNADTNRLTLTNIPPGQRTLYVWAIDKSMALSDTLTHSWYVDTLRGNLLIVNEDENPQALQQMEDIIQNLLPFTKWNLVRQFPYSPIDINLAINHLGFNKIIWLTGDNASHILFVVPYLLEFLRNGNRLLLIGPNVLTPDLVSSAFVDSFMHIDTSRIYFNKIVAQDTLIIATEPGYPDTLVTAPGNILRYIEGFHTDSLSAELYRTNLKGITDTVSVALKYPRTSPKLVYFSFQLWKVAGNITALVNHIIVDEFGGK